MIRLQGLAVCLLLVAPAPAMAQFVPDRRYEEVIDPPTPVSGHAIVGVVVVPQQQAVQSDTLWVRAGDLTERTRIRVDVASANGRRHGEGTWTWDRKDKTVQGDAAKSWHPLSVPPNGERPERPEHLAASVRQVGAEPNATPVFLVAAWGRGMPEAASKLRVYVNARRAEMFAYLPDGKTAVRCTPLQNTPTVRFDSICDIELPIGPTPGSAKLTLVRRDGNSTSRQPLELRW